MKSNLFKSSKPGILFFLLAILFGMIAAFLAVTTVSKFDRKTLAVVAKQDIEPYTEITRDMLDEIEVPLNSITGDKVPGLMYFEGNNVKFSNTLILKGTAIVKEQLTNQVGGEVTARLSKNRLDVRALAVAVDAMNGFGGKIERGDRVDIYATQNQQTASGFKMVTSQIVNNIQVIDIIKEDETKVVGIVLEVTNRQAQEIGHAIDTAKIHFTVAPQAINNKANMEPTISDGVMSQENKKSNLTN